MKNSRYSPLIAIITLVNLFAMPNQIHAQVNDLGEFIKAGVEDAEVLIKAYLEPLPNGIGAGLNTGWIKDASPHKPLGFSLQVRSSLAFVPTTDQSFDLAKLPLNNVKPANPSQSISPTVGGNDEPGPEVVVLNEGDEVARFTLPRGSGIHLVPAPMIQASVGLIKNTGVTVRYVPEVNIADYGNFQMVGVGIQHELTQWLPGENLIPVKISLFAGYSRLDLSSHLNIDPETAALPDPGYTGNYDNQKAAITFDTYTVKLIIGKNLPFVSIYGAVGYETSTMNAALLGDYPVPISGPAGITQIKTVTDPITYKQKGDNTYSLTAGVKFSLFIFNIYGQYTLADYSSVNAGIGFSFR